METEDVGSISSTEFYFETKEIHKAGTKMEKYGYLLKKKKYITKTSINICQLHEEIGPLVNYGI